MFLTLALCFAAWTLGGVINMVTGFGGGLVALPAMMLVLPANAAIPACSIPGFVSSIVIYMQYRKKADWYNAGLILAGAIPASVLGVYTLKHVCLPLLQFGTCTMLVICLSLEKLGRAKSSSWNKRTGGSILFGGFGGFSQAAVGLGGPPIALLALLSGWSKDKAKAVYGPLFVITGAAILALNTGFDLMGDVATQNGCASLVGLAAGTAIGIPLARHVSQEFFVRLTRLLILFSILLLALRAGGMI